VTYDVTVCLSEFKPPWLDNSLQYQVGPGQGTGSLGSGYSCGGGSNPHGVGVGKRDDFSYIIRETTVN
jgi:hypothetical protein